MRTLSLGLILATVVGVVACKPVEKKEFTFTPPAFDPSKIKLPPDIIDDIAKKTVGCRKSEAEIAIPAGVPTQVLQHKKIFKETQVVDCNDQPVGQPKWEVQNTAAAAYDLSPPANLAGTVAKAIIEAPRVCKKLTAKATPTIQSSSEPLVSQSSAVDENGKTRVVVNEIIVLNYNSGVLPGANLISITYLDKDEKVLGEQKMVVRLEITEEREPGLITRKECTKPSQ